jgi:penicillin-binding protein 2
MNWNHPHVLARRAWVTAWLIGGVLGIIMAAFFRLQVLGRERYEFQSNQNRVRPVVLPAPRGLITDRHGAVLADNIPSYTISVLVPTPDALDTTLAAMAPLVGLDSVDIAAILGNNRGRSDDPIVIMRDAPFEVVSALEERRRSLPGLVIQTEPKRRYPHGEAVAHVVGYVNEITEDELADESFEGGRRGALVGRNGLERVYDAELRGADGRRAVEVDALGRTVRTEGVVPVLEPDQGVTLRTSIDLELQKFVMEQFPDSSLGAVVAMDPRNGEILALHSSPSFDPNAFVGGIDRDLWREWSTSPSRPLFNRAVQGKYPPASPWKLAVAALAMRRGIANLRTRMPEQCGGGMQYYNRYFRCWKLDGHGDLTLAEAIQHSCDVYFYQLGLQLGLPEILDGGLSYGFGARTGIDLPSEATPTYPPSTDYFDRRYGPRGWTRAVTLNLSIGQGENDQTLINMVRFYAMLAREDGRSPVPRLRMDDSDVELTDPSMDLPPSSILALRQALVMVVDSGTAIRSRVASLRIAGKTGTAQNPHGPDHGWFVAFAPADAPEIVVGVIVEFAEHGSSVAPLATQVIARHILGPDSLLNRNFRLQVPADSAPIPIPLITDSTLMTLPVPTVPGLERGRS